MNELIVIAEREELKLVDKLVDKGILKKGITTLITGVGALNIISALKNIPKDRHIINIGYAGSKNLHPDFYEVSRHQSSQSNLDLYYQLCNMQHSLLHSVQHII